uniref:Uncharacterized protein n=1 Tax=Candidatus Desulfatibia profunda TaxID=2841695 RepID=A0A8J6NSL8_9BACT|nr:hypothetical protein [Candidatus Desulfatibia profunda]
MKIKTKIGELEGDPREIRDFCKMIDFDAMQFFQPEKKISIFFVLLPLFIYLVMAVVLIFKPQQDPKIILLATFAALILMAIIVAGVHLRYKNSWVSVFTALVFLLTLPMLLGWVEPREAVNNLIDIYQKPTK